MKILMGVPLPADTFQKLAIFLREHGQTEDAGQLCARAIEDWLARQGAGSRADARGLQWKELFLPDKTKLRYSCEGQYHFAEIEGDVLIHAGRTLSPHQWVVAVAGRGHNAWRSMWLRFPGQGRWQRASVLRQQALAQPAQCAPSPAEALELAAGGLNAALKQAQELVLHCATNSRHQRERRMLENRRASDVLFDD